MRRDKNRVYIVVHSTTESDIRVEKVYGTPEDVERYVEKFHGKAKSFPESNLLIGNLGSGGSL